jgi:hypothetical protein
MPRPTEIGEEAKIDEGLSHKPQKLGRFLQTYILNTYHTEHCPQGDILKSTDIGFPNSLLDENPPLVVRAGSDVIIDRPPSPLQLKPQHWDF